MEIRQHLRFAARQLSRNPGFTAMVIMTLALSIGANTAIFSMVNALMLKSLPYAHPEQMGTVYARVTGRGTSDERTGIDGEKWELLRDNVPTLISGVSGGTSGVNLQAGSPPTIWTFWRSSLCWAAIFWRMKTARTGRKLPF
jgi:hypothetical protein